MDSFDPNMCSELMVDEVNNFGELKVGICRCLINDLHVLLNLLILQEIDMILIV